MPACAGIAHHRHSPRRGRPAAPRLPHYRAGKRQSMVMGRRAVNSPIGRVLPQFEFRFPARSYRRWHTTGRLEMPQPDLWEINSSEAGTLSRSCRTAPSKIVTAARHAGAPARFASVCTAPTCYDRHMWARLTPWLVAPSRGTASGNNVFPQQRFKNRSCGLAFHVRDAQ
jgi:hypothetical protein